MNNNIVELKNVSKVFENSSILENINFSIRPNGQISICGASGSGKTTLVNIIGMLESPTSGQVIWNNADVTNFHESKLSKMRSQIFGYIFQQCNLISELNVLENILFPKMMMGNIEKSDKEFAKSLMEVVGLTGFDNRNVLSLSGGERQRVAVIRSFINRPNIIVADEPTGSLDEKSANVVMQMIMDLCKSNSSALLLITHNPEFSEKMKESYILSAARLTKL